jgi:hypothetical protein
LRKAVRILSADEASIQSAKFQQEVLSGKPAERSIELSGIRMLIDMCQKKLQKQHRSAQVFGAAAVIPQEDEAILNDTNSSPRSKLIAQTRIFDREILSQTIARLQDKLKE